MCYSLGMANLLRGAHAISLDVKGRLAIPTKYRDWLRDECDGQLVCTIDIAHPCLLLYPLHEWEEIERKLKTLEHGSGTAPPAASAARPRDRM